MLFNHIASGSVLVPVGINRLAVSCGSMIHPTRCSQKTLDFRYRVCGSRESMADDRRIRACLRRFVGLESDVHLTNLFRAPCRLRERHCRDLSNRRRTDHQGQGDRTGPSRLRRSRLLSSAQSSTGMMGLESLL